MKKIFSILLSLALVVSLSLVAAAPVMAVELPSISPTTAEYNLDNPQHVAVNMDFGDADDLLDVEDDIGTLTPDTDYYQFENLLVFPESYFAGVFTCVGEEWIIQINFDSFGVAFLTVTCVGTAPALEEDSMEWDFWLGGDVVVGIDWGCAGDIDSVSDDIGALGFPADWTHDSTTLTIEDAYLTTKLTSLGDDVELEINFDSCYYVLGTGAVDHTFTLTIEAVGVTSPRLAPTSATYDKCNPDDVEFAITWAGAASITKVENVTSLVSPSTLSGPGACSYPASAWNVASNTLTICQWYIALATAALGAAYLKVTFNDASEVHVLITAVWSEQPWMGVTSNIYTYNIDTTPGVGNVGALGVGSLANFGCATNVTGVHDQTPAPVSYSVYYIAGYGYLVCIGHAYLMANLTFLGDSATFSVGFDKGANATFIINAVGTQPSISPTSAEFNLDDPADVTTTVTLGPHATSYTIKKGDDVLTLDEDYTVSGDIVSINASYLSSVLAAVDDVVVLKFDFNEGEDANLTVRAVGTPLCFIATAAGADAPALDILREFRDEVLRPNSVGAKLVSLYYEASPPIAELISQNEALKTAVKVCLIDPIVAILNWSQCLWS